MKIREVIERTPWIIVLLVFVFLLYLLIKIAVWLYLLSVWSKIVLAGFVLFILGSVRSENTESLFGNTLAMFFIFAVFVLFFISKLAL